MEPKTTSALLYLDGITVSFDGFRALNELSFVLEPREMRGDYRTERCRQDHDDGCHHRAKPGRTSGDVYFEQGSYDLSSLMRQRLPSLASAASFRSRRSSICIQSRTI